MCPITTDETKISLFLSCTVYSDTCAVCYFIILFSSTCLRLEQSERLLEEYLFVSIHLSSRSCLPTFFFWGLNIVLPLRVIFPSPQLLVIPQNRLCLGKCSICIELTKAAGVCTAKNVFSSSQLCSF